MFGMTHESTSAKVLQELNRHQQRRNGGVPTLSVLVGALGMGLNYWRNWTLASGRKSIFVRPEDRSPAQAIAGEWILQPWILDRLIDYLSPDLDIPSDRVRDILEGTACRERSHVVSRMILVSPSDSMETLSRALLSISGNRVSDSLDEQIASQLIEALATVEGPHAPGILFLGNHAAEKTARSLADLIDLCPGTPVGWTVSEKDFSASILPMPASRARTVCQEGFVFIGESSAEIIRQRLLQRIRAGTGSLNEATCRRLADDGASDALLDRLAAAIDLAALSRNGLEPMEKARSAAEAFLYHRLESLPETSGLFELNGELSADWGPRGRLEVDLLCEKKMLAVEVDGYFHFIDTDRYRRDRRKDFLLQRRGFLVLRFLAEDVVAKIEMILDTILASLRWRDVQDAKRGRQSE